tara:strand:- start:1067 stop:1981 length:915 start_codon:yes stop_codon:yes gene_type:complete
MNKTILNFIFYLCISLFAFQCGASETPEIIDPQEHSQPSEADMYIDELKTKKPAINDVPDLEINESNILVTEIQQELFDTRLDLKNLKALVAGLQKQLDAETDFDPSELWSSPFSIYNQEVLLESGSVMYGNIIYQDREIITLETIIGKINLNRPEVVRIISHHPELAKEDPLESWNVNPVIEDGSLLYEKPAEVILYGSMFSSVDVDGNQTLKGNLKNIGGKRADFVKINITLFRDWSSSLEPKTFTVFVDGETQYLNASDSTMVSRNTISPKAFAPFELIVPKSFGTVMSWTYEIDYEEYEK